MMALRRTIATMAEHSELEISVIFDEALRNVAQALGGAMTCLHLHDDQSSTLQLVAASGLDSKHHKKWRSLDSRADELPSQVLTEGKSVHLFGPQSPDNSSGLISTLVQGLDVRVGVITAVWPEDQSVEHEPEMLLFMEAMSDLLAVAIEHYGLVSEMVDNMGRIVELKTQADERNVELNDLNTRLKEANQRLVELSITDGLTGLYNHRYIHQRLEEELLRSKRSDKPISLVMADLDYFKKLNDRLGHLQGDEALRRFSGWLRDGVRKTDLVGRFGGEEFMVILLDCGLEKGLKVAEKVRRTVEKESQAPPFDEVGGFTVSLGVAQWDGDQSISQLIEQSDIALYKAKQGGRNQVCAAAD